jgi:uncharacterized PurR-regulated membrane protein YhhQ (DUF165 family)
MTTVADRGKQAVELSSRYLLAAGFLGCIITANYVTTRYGMVPVGFGLVATAGTYFAGASFVLRDSVQDTSGRRWVVALIAAGAVLSFLIAAPFIALASAVAFLLSETADFAIYQPLRRRGYIRAAIASNIAGTLVDTFAFLWIAGFPIQRAFAGQLVGKLTITAVVVLGVVVVRAVSRQPLRPEGGAGHA